jgi:hypothetical protein
MRAKNASSSVDKSRSSRAHLEALLDGRVDRPEMLGAVLDAARAPGNPAELGGLAAATAVFATASRGVHGDVVASGHRRKLLTRLVAPALAFKLLAAAAGAVALAGVSYAAVTGHLAPHHPATSAVVTASHGRAHPSTPGGLPGSGAGGSQSTGPGRSSQAQGSPSPTPSYTGLCQAWLADSTVQSHANPAFDALIAKAGGRDLVTPYCTTLLGSSSTHPTHPATPHRTGQPSGDGAPTHPGKSSHAPTHSPSPSNAVAQTSSPSVPTRTPGH